MVLHLFNNKLVTTGNDQNLLGLPGAKRNRKDNTIEFPKEYKIATDILKLRPDIHLSPAVDLWMSAVRQSRKTREQMKKIPLENMTVPYADKLFGYQRKGVNFMVNSKRAINGDDMGLGKTLQTITTCMELNLPNILIVCPNSLKNTWAREFKVWTGKEATVVKASTKKKTLSNYTGGILIINYESVWDRKTKTLIKELEQQWDIVVYDEAHRLKNRQATQTKACKRIKSTYCYLLTGTPMENSPDELWSLLNLLYPQQFNSYWRFVDQWCSYKQFEVSGRLMKVINGCQDKKGLHDLLSPIMIRRLKKEVLPELPDKTWRTVPVDINPADKQVYEELKKDLLSVLPSGEVVITPNVLSQLTRLRQISISHQLLDETVPIEEVKSAKFDTIMDIVSDGIDQHKMVIFTQFKKGLKALKYKLEKKGIKCLEISGDVSFEDRQANCEKFQTDPSVRIILCTIQTAGVGLTLTEADTCIFMDKHYNPQLNKQAEDRLYRIGQKNNVQVISILAQGTVEEKIETQLQAKNEMFDQIVDGLNLTELL